MSATDSWEELGAEIHRLLDVATPRTRDRVAALYSACRRSDHSDPNMSSATSAGALRSSATSASSLQQQQLRRGKHYTHHHRDAVATTSVTATATSRPAGQRGAGGYVCALPDTPSCLAAFASNHNDRERRWLVVPTLSGAVHTVRLGSGDVDAWEPCGGSTSLAPFGAALCVASCRSDKDHQTIFSGTTSGAVVVHRLPLNSPVTGREDHREASYDCAEDSLLMSSSPPITPFLLEGAGVTTTIEGAFDGMHLAHQSDALRDSGDFVSVSSSKAASKEVILIPWAAPPPRGRSDAQGGSDVDDVGSMDPPSSPNMLREGEVESVACGGGAVGSMILSGSDSRSSLGSSTPSSDDGAAVGRTPPPARRLVLTSPTKRRSVVDVMPTANNGAHSVAPSPLVFVGHAAAAASQPAAVTALTLANELVLWGTRSGGVCTVPASHFVGASSMSPSSRPMLPEYSGATPNGSPITQICVLPGDGASVIAAATWDGYVWVFDPRAGPRPMTVAPPCRRSSSVKRGGGMERALHSFAAGFATNSGATSTATAAGAPIRSLMSWDPSHPSQLLAANDDGIVRLLDTRRFMSSASLTTPESLVFTKAQTTAPEVWVLRAGHKAIVHVSRHTLPQSSSLQQLRHDLGPQLTVCFQDNSVKVLHIRDDQPLGGKKSIAGVAQRGSSSSDRDVSPAHSFTSANRVAQPSSSVARHETHIRSKRGSENVSAVVEQQWEMITSSSSRCLGATVTAVYEPGQTADDLVGGGSRGGHVFQGLAGGVVTHLRL